MVKQHSMCAENQWLQLKRSVALRNTLWLLHFSFKRKLPDVCSTPEPHKQKSS